MLLVAVVAAAVVIAIVVGVAVALLKCKQRRANWEGGQSRGREEGGLPVESCAVSVTCVPGTHTHLRAAVGQVPGR